MIWDVDSPSWWTRTIPHRNGIPTVRYFAHFIKGWFLVVDPFSPLKFYFVDRAAGIWRTTPPPLDRDAGTQTTSDLITSHCSENGYQTDPPDQAEAECQTNALMFVPESSTDADVWASLGSTVARLPPGIRTAVYNRLIRFLEMGLLNLDVQRELPLGHVDQVCGYCLTFARVLFRICNFCKASPSYHHGRCCPRGLCRTGKRSRRSMEGLPPIPENCRERPQGITEVF